MSDRKRTGPGKDVTRKATGKGETRPDTTAERPPPAPSAAHALPPQATTIQASDAETVTQLYVDALKPPPASPSAPAEPMGMLDLEEPPETYGFDQVVVLPRDPYTVFADWEVTPQAWDSARTVLGSDGRLTLRMVAVTPHPEAGLLTTTHDHPLDWDHGRRYFGAPRPGALVSAAVGLLTSDGRFAAMAHAPRVRVPYAEPAPPGPVEWMEVEPARTRGRDREPPRIRARGPAREVSGTPWARPDEGPRWRGEWESFGGSRVPPQPDSRQPSGPPTSPGRWRS